MTDQVRDYTRFGTAAGTVQRNKVLRESLMLTDDENIVDLQFAVQYTVRDARDYLFIAGQWRGRRIG